MAVIIGAYAIFGLRGYLFGPIVSIDTPKNGAVVSQGLLEVRGTTKRVKSLTINGALVTLLPDASFSFPVAVFKPYTIMEIIGTDTFGKEKKIIIELGVE